MIQRILVLFTVCVCLSSFEEDNDTISTTISNTSENIEIDKLQTYLGQFEFCYKNNDTVRLSEYKLVDWKNEQELSFDSINLVDIKSISFLVGVDSNEILNGAMEGDLDPGKGMFWTWQSGYINLKLEYREEKKSKIFHIGGYSGIQNSVQRLTFIIPDERTLRGISFNVNEFSEFVNSQNYSMVMSPGQKAISIAEHYSDFFKPILE